MLLKNKIIKNNKIKNAIWRYVLCVLFYRIKTKISANFIWPIYNSVAICNQQTSNISLKEYSWTYYITISLNIIFYHTVILQNSGNLRFYELLQTWQCYALKYSFKKKKIWNGHCFRVRDRSAFIHLNLVLIASLVSKKAIIFHFQDAKQFQNQQWNEAAPWWGYIYLLGGHKSISIGIWEITL